MVELDGGTDEHSERRIMTQEEKWMWGAMRNLHIEKQDLKNERNQLRIAGKWTETKDVFNRHK